MAAAAGGEERPSGAAPGSSGSLESSDALVPPGYGTLRQDAITLRLQRDDLLIEVTPLEPAVIRVLATDTWERLRDLREGHRPELVRRSGFEDPDLFLVSFFTYEQDVPFQPEDLHLVNRGLRFRPLGIQAVTPDWGRQRLSQERTQMAIYAFDPSLDLDQDLSVEYQDVRRGGWERVLQEIQGERARILARARSAR